LKPAVVCHRYALSLKKTPFEFNICTNFALLYTRFALLTEEFQMIKGMAHTALLLACGFASTALAEQTSDPEQLFQQAMQLRDQGQVYRAIELFETLISQQPGLGRARLELAVAYHNARRFEEARQQLVKVLNDPDTPETVKLSITAYLAQLGSDEKATLRRTSASVYVSAGLFTDSNVNLGPSPETPNVSATETDGTGMTATVSISHLSRAPKPLQINERPVDMEWHSQATAYAKAYSGDENDYNVQVLSLRTGPALVDNGNWRGSVNFRLDKVFFDDNPYSFNVGLNPTFALIFDNDTELSFEALTMVREFASSADRGLDGSSNMYGVGLAKFYNKLSIGVQVGLRYHSNGADADYLNAQGAEIYISGQMPAWEDARTYLQLSSRDYDYRGADPAASNPPRDETESQAILGVSHDFTSGALKSWTLNSQITYTKNDSNVAIFEYDRTVFEVNMRSYF